MILTHASISVSESFAEDIFFFENLKLGSIEARRHGELEIRLAAR